MSERPSLATRFNGINIPPAWLAPLPYLTSALPGIGGVLKQQPEDFEVDEIPAYEPSGTGEHLFLWVMKIGLSAEELLQHVSRVCRISRGDIGMAGLKDRQAITRQYLSIPVRAEARVAELESPQVRILSSSRHQNKLRTGHLRGNRFRIRLRQVTGSVDAARAILDVLRAQGLPNYFGEQRFGREFENLRYGLGFLSGEISPSEISPARRRFLVRMTLSAVQSALFNRVLASRIEREMARRVLAGDVLQVVQSGGPFVSTDPGVDQARLEAGEVITTGPIFGPRMKQPTGDGATFERQFLEECQLDASAWEKFPQLTSGTRRPLMVVPQELDVTAEEGATLLFQFVLPPGCYATVLLREVQKQSSELTIPDQGTDL